MRRLESLEAGSLRLCMHEVNISRSNESINEDVPTEGIKTSNSNQQKE